MNKFEMKQLAYQSQLKSRSLQVLLYLIDRADKEQTCFPAVATIGRELHISISTVKRAMRELVEAGFVTKESRFREGNGGQTSNLYTLFFPENGTESEHKNTGESKEAKSVKENGGQMKITGDSESEAAACAEVTGGEGQNDTALSFQFNQGLKSGKRVYSKTDSTIFNFLTWCQVIVLKVIFEAEIEINSLKGRWIYSYYRNLSKLLLCNRLFVNIAKQRIRLTNDKGKDNAARTSGSLINCCFHRVYFQIHERLRKLNCGYSSAFRLNRFKNVIVKMPKFS